MMSISGKSKNNFDLQAVNIVCCNEHEADRVFLRHIRWEKIAKTGQFDVWHIKRVILWEMLLCA